MEWLVLCLVTLIDLQTRRAGLSATVELLVGPLTAKSQLIWIKVCTHLLLYGVHLWADLERDRRVGVGGTRPNQND